MVIDDEGNSASKRSRNQEGAGTEVDRISNLPESVLLHILSFLPALYVARTCILSKRWQNVWTCVPCLDFDYSTCYKAREAFVNFVNTFLLQFKAGSVKKFRINSTQSTSRDTPTEAWVRWAIDRKVEELDLKSHMSLLHLPQTTLGCKTLVKLKLMHHQVSMTFPPTACIPSLKTLELISLRSPDEEFENKLISCCVVLENLSIKRLTNVGVKSYRIHSHKLKHLKIEYNVPLHLNRVWDGCVIDINAPTLEDLDIEGRYGIQSLLLANVGGLNKAKIHLKGLNTYQSLLKCFSALNNVKSLCLSSESEQVCKLEPGLTVHLVNLTHLTLGARSIWVQLLPYFFKCFPNLEVLTLKAEKSSSSYADENLCSDLELLPKGLLSRLRVFDAEEFWEDELGMLGYILKHGKALELVQIQYSCSSETDEEFSTRKGTKAREFEEKYIDCEEERSELEEKFRVAQEILSFPRASPYCEIKFS